MVVAGMMMVTGKESVTVTKEVLDRIDTSTFFLELETDEQSGAKTIKLCAGDSKET
jgi:hypothetical protein